jgi:DNA-binding response OmpR family regulator
MRPASHRARITVLQTILVVEDDEQVRAFIKTVLKQAGYLVMTARNGQEASQFLEQCEPHLLITDLAMPQKPGNVLIEEVRTHHPAIPILAISGALTAQPGIYRKIARSLGANYLLAKPFSHDDLLQMVKGALRE